MSKKLYIGYDGNINDFRIGTLEELAGGQREVKLEVEDWITEITTRETITKLENKLIESFRDIIEIK